MRKDKLNPELMIGDEVTVLDVDRSFGTMNSPERFRDYVVTGIKYPNKYQPSNAKTYYQLEPIGMSDEDRLGGMLAGGGKRRDERLYVNDDTWVLRPGFLRGELNEHKETGLNPELEVDDIIRIIDIDREVENNAIKYHIPPPELKPEKFIPYAVVDKESNGSESKYPFRYTLVPEDKLEDYEKNLDRGYGEYKGYEKLLFPWVHQWIYADIPMANKVDRLTISEHNQPGLSPDLDKGDIIRVIEIDGEHANMPDIWGVYKVHGISQDNATQEFYYQLSGETSEVIHDRLMNGKYLYHGDVWIPADMPITTKVDRKTIHEQKEANLNPQLKIGDEIIVLDVGVEVKNDMNKPDKYIRYFVTKIYTGDKWGKYNQPYYGLNRPDVDVTDPERPGVYDQSSTHKHLYPRTDTWMFNPKGPTMRYEDAFQPEVYMPDEEYEELYGDGADDQDDYLEEQVDGKEDGAERLYKNHAHDNEDYVDNSPFTPLEIRILNTLHKYLDRSELQKLSQETPQSYGEPSKKFWDIMKIFGITPSNQEEDTRVSKYAKWALDNWREEGDYGSIEEPIKEKLKWYQVDREESGSQIEYKDGTAEVLGFDGDEAGERADYDFYSWGGEMETHDYGDYESYDSEITNTEFLRVDESITPQMKEELLGPQKVQDLLFNFWKKVGPTLEPDKLKLIGFNMNDNQDIRLVMMNLVEYYGDEELVRVMTERLEGLQGWEYEYKVINIDIRSFNTYPIEVMVDVMVNGDQKVPVTTADDGIIDITLWDSNEKAREEWQSGGPGPYDNLYEEVREAVLSDINILLENLPVDPMLDYVDFSEPGSFDEYDQPLEVITEDEGYIDDMVYIDEPREKHIRRMDRGLGSLVGFPLDKWKNMPPPQNESDTTEEEIEYLEDIPVDKKLVDSADEIVKHFTKFLTTKKLEYPQQELKELMVGVKSIILILKYHYNRPRPFQIAQAKGLELNSETLESSSSPSYPSGHATQGRFVARYLSDLYPEYREELMQIGEDIAYSRNMAKVHYPSDSTFGKLLGDEMYDFINPNTINESAPQPGSSSAEGFDDKNLPHETEYLTLDEILSRVKNIAYYKEVLRDLQDDKEDWEVTKTVKRYADYWMENPESLTGPDFPPIQVIGDGMKDGSHRISTLNALANHIDVDNPYWKEVKLEVRFYDPETVMASGHYYPWLWDISDEDLQQAIEDKVYNWEVLERWLADPNAKSDLEKLRAESVKEQVMMKKGDMLKADIFKFLSNRFALTNTDYSEIKDNNGNYYRLIDMEEPYEDVKLTHLLNPVVDFVSSGIDSGTFDEEDIQKGLEAVTDWVSLAMNQKKDLVN